MGEEDSRFVVVDELGFEFPLVVGEFSEVAEEVICILDRVDGVGGVNGVKGFDGGRVGGWCGIGGAVGESIVDAVDGVDAVANVVEVRGRPVESRLDCIFSGLLILEKMGSAHGAAIPWLRGIG